MGGFLPWDRLEEEGPRGVGRRGGGPHRGDETWLGDVREHRWWNELQWQGLTGADGAICVAKMERWRKGKVEGSFYRAE
jgi:hypothetical protein